MRRILFLSLASVASLTLGACPKPQILPAGPPLRPPVVEDNTGQKPPTDGGPTDCPKTTVDDGLPSVAYAQRSITESNNDYKDGDAKLQLALAPGVDETTKQDDLKQAVDSLIQALQADPYNVKATYDLAAAYAEIDRKQCSLNMLDRVIQMRSHPSKKAAAEASLDHLLGRKKTPMDPAFKKLRGDQGFRDLIANMCKGSTDPDCAIH